MQCLHFRLSGDRSIKAFDSKVTKIARTVKSIKSKQRSPSVGPLLCGLALDANHRANGAYELDA